MLHIHYINGPEVLKDISIEVSNKVIELIHKNKDDEFISAELDVSCGVVDAIREMLRLRLRRCSFCGRLFDPKGHSRTNTCGDIHYLPCVDCGIPVKVNESYANYMKAGGRRCQECRGKQIGATRHNKSPEEHAKIVAKQQQTMMERYGGKTALNVPEMKAKIQATVKERYGVDNLSQSKEIQRRISENSMKKYGVNHYSNAPEIRKHMTDGMIDKFGVTNPMQSEELKQKAQSTNLERYGYRNVFQNEEVRQKAVANHLAKYGVEWSHQRPE